MDRIDKVLIMPKRNMIGVLLFLYICKYITIGFPLQNLMNSSSMQSMKYCSITVLFMPYLTQVGFVMYPLLIALTALNAILMVVQKYVKRQKLSRSIKNFAIMYLYVLKQTQTVVFLPHLQISFERKYYIQLIVLLAAELYIYIMYMFSTDPSEYSKDIMKQSKGTLLFIDLLIDFSTFTQSFLINVYYSFFNAISTSSTIALLYWVKRSVTGNSYLDQILQSLCIYFFISTILVSVYLFLRVDNASFAAVFLTLQIVLLLSQNIYLFKKRAKQIIKVAKNIHFLENAAFSLRQNMKSYHQKINQYQSELKLLQVDPEPVNSEIYDEQMLVKQIWEKLVSETEQQLGVNKMSPVYYDLMTAYLSKKKVKLEDIEGYCVTETDTKTSNLDEMSVKYTREQVTTLFDKLKLTTDDLVQTAHYLDRIMNQRSPSQFQHLVQQLQMQNTIDFDTTHINDVEKMQVYNFLKLQIKKRITCCLELACYMDQQEFAKTYIIYLLRQYVDNPKLILITNYQQNKVQQQSLKLKQKQKKVQADLTIELFDQTEEKNFETTIISKEKLNQLCDQVFTLADVQESNIQFDEKQTLNLQQSKHQAEQIKTWKNLQEEYQVILKLMDPIKSQIKDFDILQQLIQKIVQIAKSLEEQTKYYQDSLLLFANIQTAHHLHQQLKQRIQDISVLATSYNERDLQFMFIVESEWLNTLLKEVHYILEQDIDEDERKRRQQQFQSISANNNYFITQQLISAYQQQLQSLLHEIDQYLVKIPETQFIKQLLDNEFQPIAIKYLLDLVTKAFEFVPLAIQLQEIFIRQDEQLNKYQDAYRQRFQVNYKEHCIVMKNKPTTIQQQVQKIEQNNFQYFEQQTIKSYDCVDKVSKTLFQFQYYLHMYLKNKTSAQIYDAYGQVYSLAQSTKKHLAECLDIMFMEAIDNPNNSQNINNLHHVLSYFYNIQFNQDGLNSIFNIFYGKSSNQATLLKLMKSNGDKFSSAQEQENADNSNQLQSALSVYVQNQADNIVHDELTGLHKINSAVEEDYKPKFQPQSVKLSIEKQEENKNKQFFFQSSFFQKLKNGPPALYEFKGKVKLFKHFQAPYSSQIQANLRKLQKSNGRLIAIFSLLTAVALVICTLNQQRMNYHMVIGKEVLDKQANLLVLRPLLENYKYLQDKPVSLEFRQVQDLYKKNFEQIESKLIQSQKTSSQTMSSFVMYIQYVFNIALDSLVRLVQLVFTKFQLRGSGTVSNVTLVNKTISVNGNLYQNSRAFQTMEKAEQIGTKQETNEIMLYQKSYDVKFFLFTVLKSFWTVIPQLLMKTKSDDGENSGIVLMYYGKNEFINRQLYSMTVLQVQEQLVSSEENNVQYRGNIYVDKYLNYYTADPAKQLAEYMNSFATGLRTTYPTPFSKTIPDTFIKLKSKELSQMSVEAGVIVIVFLIFAYMIGAFACFYRNNKRETGEMQAQMYKHLAKNYADYIPDDLLNNKLYKDYNTGKHYTNFINNLNDDKVTISAAKFRNYVLDKNVKLFETASNSHCDTKAHKQIFSIQCGDLAALVTILGVLTFYFINLLQQLNSTSLKTYTNITEHQNAIIQTLGVTTRYSMFGNQMDLDMIIDSLHKADQMASIQCQYLEEAQCKQAQSIYDQFVASLSYNILYMRQQYCQSSNTRPRQLKFLLENQHNIPLPQYVEDPNFCTNTDSKISGAIQNFTIISNLALQDYNAKYKIITDKYPNFETDYPNLNTIADIMKFGVFSDKLIEAANLAAQLIDISNQAQKQMNSNCDVYKTQLNYYKMTSITYIVLTLLLVLALTTATMVRKQFPTKITVSCLIIQILILFIVPITHNFSVKGQCNYYESNYRVGEQIKQIQGLINQVNIMSVFGNYDELYSQYEQYQKVFPRSQFHSNFSIQDIINGVDANILGQIALTNKSFVDLVNFAPNPKYIELGDYSINQDFMEYLVILGAGLNIPENSVTNSDPEGISVTTQYAISIFIGLVVLAEICIIFYVLFQKHVYQTEKGEVTTKISVKPYITVLLAEKNGKLSYKYQQPYIENQMYVQKWPQFFAEQKSVTDKLLESDQGLDQIVKNLPDFVAAITDQNQQQLITPSVCTLNVAEYSCKACCDRKVEEYLNKQEKSRNKQFQKPENKVTQLFSQLPFTYLAFIAFTSIWFVIAILIQVSQYVSCKNQKVQYKQYAMLAYELQEALCLYEKSRMEDNKQSLYYGEQSTKSFRKFNDVIRVLNQGNFEVNFSRNIIVRAGLLKEGLIHKNFEPVLDLAVYVQEKLQTIVGQHQNFYNFFFTIWVYFVFLIIGVIILQNSLWIANRLYVWQDLLYGFVTRNRKQLSECVVR
ncbi:Conserved_hypothetical protein [Hexamita inflata]|uniref:Transmembrane protein n=1 Tax=Hexamita inflata TaxID=28002 RepID=A0AA86PHX5_9EUKA|nr:Conserved hypothetical protein [Hexamita inflata]